jgi:hypothetical protein
VGELHAHQISTVTGILLFGVYIWMLVRIWRPTSTGQALTIGLVWLGMTVAFEFLFGHYVAKRPWRDLLHDYNLFAGRVWLVVLVWVTLAPYLFYQLQRYAAVIVISRKPQMSYWLTGWCYLCSYLFAAL